MLDEQAQCNLRILDRKHNSSSIQFKNSWAVVVGINDYGSRYQRLANAMNDAIAFALMLKDELGFEKENITTLLGDKATKGAIRELLENKLPTKVGPEDQLIIFFSGHGSTEITKQGKTQGYLIPHDAHWGKTTDYLNMEEFTSAFKNINAKNILLVLDCCFSGISAVTQERININIENFYSESNFKFNAWQVLAAGEKDELVTESTYRSDLSAFTSALLDGLSKREADKDKDNIITVSELFNYVKKRVSEDISHKNIKGPEPTFGYLKGSELGEYIFILPHHHGLVSREQIKSIGQGSQRACLNQEEIFDLTDLIESNPTVVGYSRTLKDEIVKGKPSGRKAIRIYVAKKRPTSELSQDQVLPEYFGGHPIDVVEIGELNLLELADQTLAPTENFRPLIGGISISRNGSVQEAGTLGYFVKDQDGYWYVLSSEHVLGSIPNMPIIQPGNLDKGKHPDDLIAKLFRSIKNDMIDAAIARLNIDALPSLNGLPSPIGAEPAKDHMSVVKSGRTTKVTHGEIIDASADIKVNNKIYRDQIVIRSRNTSSFAGRGDSGSLIIHENANRAVGLIFAGNNNNVIANHITTILDAFKVALVSPYDDFR